MLTSLPRSVLDALAFAEENNLTVQVHLEELRRFRDLAREQGQLSAAIHAEVKRGEVVGFYVRRRENVTELSAEERAERVQALLSLAESRGRGQTCLIAPADARGLPPRRGGARDEIP
jgi:hypothetical protein